MVAIRIVLVMQERLIQKWSHRATQAHIFFGGKCRGLVRRHVIIQKNHRQHKSQKNHRQHNTMILLHVLKDNVCDQCCL